jgi:hydrogenase maturation protein HypF
VPTIAARFHRGAAAVVAATIDRLAAARAATGRPVDTVALSGVCFHNRLLLEETLRRLHAAGFTVLMHAEAPAGDGGLTLGQAAIAAAQAITENPTVSGRPFTSATGWG